jgi:Ca2+-binding RTX toxin-like protein
MTVINASTASAAVILSPFSDQFDYQIQDPAGPNSSTSYSWISSGNDDMAAFGNGMDFTDPTPDFGNVTSMNLDLSNNNVNDVTMTNITALNGGGAISAARLGVMVDSMQLFFDEVMSHDDTITGSNHNDVLKAGGGSDDLNLGSGDDSGFGGDGADTLSGSSGNDSLSGEAGDDSLNGGSGEDTLTGGTGADTMNAGDGDDIYNVDNAGDVTAESFNDALGGVDLVNASASHTIGFGIENLTLTGTAAINGTGNTNANVITGNTGNNQLTGLNGNDTMNGGSGNDTLDGGNGNDSLLGSSGNDSLLGGSSNDTMRGGSGNDSANGGSGNDWLFGDSGNDVLNGGSGNDTISGGSGQDVLTGIGGNDVFDFNTVSDSTPGARDRIDGFDNAGGGNGDLIDLSGIDAITGGGDDNFAFLGVIQNPFPPPTAPGSLWLRNENGDTHVYGNVDADFDAEFALRIVDGAVGAGAYTVADFMV